MFVSSEILIQNKNKDTVYRTMGQRSAVDLHKNFDITEYTYHYKTTVSLHYCVYYIKCLVFVSSEILIQNKNKDTVYRTMGQRSAVDLHKNFDITEYTYHYKTTVSSLTSSFIKISYAACLYTMTH